MKIEFDGFSYDPSDGSLGHRDRTGERTLRPQVGRLLETLATQRGRVLGREQIYREIWGEGRVVDFESGLAALVKELRQALDEVGGGAALVETVPRRGFRLRAGAASKNPASVGPDQQVAIRLPKIAFAIGLAAALAVLAGLLVWPDRQGASDEMTVAPTLAILPFEEFGEADFGHAGIRLADALLAELWERELEGLELIGRTSLMPYRERDDIARAVAEDLGVDLLLEGSLAAEAGGWRADIRLLGLPDGRVLWSIRLEHPASELPPITALAGEAMDRLSVDWPDVSTRRFGTTDGNGISR